MKLSSRSSSISSSVSSHMSGNKDQQLTPEEFIRKFDKLLATKYARDHLIKEARKRNRASSSVPQFMKPRMDIRDDPNSPSIIAHLELPGLKPNEVAIQLQDEKLVISGERVAPQVQNVTSLTSGASPRPTYPVQELKYGAFRRIIDLPLGVQAHQLTASMSDGILELSWPRDPVRLPPILKSDPDARAHSLSHILG